MPSRHLRREVAASELIGTWSLTPESMNIFREIGVISGGQEPQRCIILNKFGTCSFQSYSQQAERFVRAEGTWRIRYGNLVERHAKSNLLVIHLDRLNAAGKKSYEALYLAETGGALILWHYLGDADSRIFIEYKKQE